VSGRHPNMVMCALERVSNPSQAPRLSDWPNGYRDTGVSERPVT
jgi:hypothetical protein